MSREPIPEHLYRLILTSIPSVPYLEAGIVKPEEGTDAHRYSPEPQLAEMLDQLADIYTRNLIGVTEVIHSRTARKAQQFADAFKWRKGDS